MKNIILRFSLILFLFACCSLFSQSAPESSEQQPTVVVKMKDGERYRGQLVERDEEQVVLRTANGELRLLASKIFSIEEDSYTGKFRFQNPHTTRYFFGPTGMPIEKGSGYYQNLLFTTHFVNYGITKNISIGGGFEFISTIIFGDPIYFLTPKAGFRISDKLYAAGGFLMAGFDDEGTATLSYGVLTYGTSDSNISIGAGYGLVDGEFSNHPSIMVGGTHRLSSSIAFLSENYLFPGDSVGIAYLGIQGIRILSRKNAFDLGVIIIPEVASEIPALPFVGYARAF